MFTSIRPQAGAQEMFLSSQADIAIYGGAAGGGKSFALLMEPLRHIAKAEFRGVIFRRKSPQIKNPGGLWDVSASLYPKLDAQPRVTDFCWQFPSGAQVKFAQLERPDSPYDWQGAQIPFIGFDELTHFTESQFFYMLSRNRGGAARPYVRATTNPDADSWVAKLIAWWIGEDGYPIKERAGICRYFMREGGELLFADDPSGLPNPDQAKSLTFIPATLEDNPLLLKSDPGYRASLAALPTVERERLLSGNWKIRPASGLYFPRHIWPLFTSLPPGRRETVRAWDLAATREGKNTDPDWTVGVKLSRDSRQFYCIEDVVRLRGHPAEVEAAILATARQDGKAVRIILPQDPGQAGKAQSRWLTGALAGFSVTTVRESGSKITRAAPFSAQVCAGNVGLLDAPWTAAFIDELDRFPDGGHDDQVDAASTAFAALTESAPVARLKLGGL